MTKSLFMDPNEVLDRIIYNIAAQDKPLNRNIVQVIFGDTWQSTDICDAIKLEIHSKNIAKLTVILFEKKIIDYYFMPSFI